MESSFPDHDPCLPSLSFANEAAAFFEKKISAMKSFSLHEHCASEASCGSPQAKIRSPATHEMKLRRLDSKTPNLFLTLTS
jgi:hypothetical protein